MDYSTGYNQPILVHGNAGKKAGVQFLMHLTDDPRIFSKYQKEKFNEAYERP
jgi:hypothetical protein